MSAVAQSERGVPRVRSDRWVTALASLLAVLLVAATAEIVLDGAAGVSALIPKSPAVAAWLGGIGVRLGYRTFLIALLVFTGAYGGLMLIAGRAGAVRVSKRWAIVLIGVLHAIVFVGPILISTDVFSYIAYARMGVEHGLNPYLNGPVAISADPVFRYVGHDWRTVATAYGPLYTLLSYPLAPLGVEGALWAMKLEALLASLGTLALTWRCARVRGFDPVLAILIVGANPLYIIYGLGGAHNDLIMMLAMMGAVSLTIVGPRSSGKEAGAAALVVAGALVKATVAVLLPFMILSRRRIAPIAGALGALVLGTLIGYIAFGVHGIDVDRHAQPRLVVRLLRRLRDRDRPSVRQAWRVPGGPSPAQGHAPAGPRLPAVANLARL